MKERNIWDLKEWLGCTCHPNIRFVGLFLEYIPYTKSCHVKATKMYITFHIKVKSASNYLVSWKSWSNFGKLLTNKSAMLTDGFEGTIIMHIVLKLSQGGV